MGDYREMEEFLAKSREMLRQIEGSFAEGTEQAFLADVIRTQFDLLNKLFRDYKLMEERLTRVTMQASGRRAH